MLQISTRAKIVAIFFTILAVALIITKLVAYQIFSAQYQVPNNGKFKLLIIWTQGLGERELLARYPFAAKNLDIEFRAVSATLHDNTIERLVGDLPKAAIKAMQPDVVIALQDGIEPYPGVTTYRMLDTNHSQYVMRDAYDTKLIFKGKSLAKFDGYLISFQRLDLIEQACANCNKKFHGLNWYPSVHRVHYDPPVPKRLFYNGGSGILRNSEKYRRMLSILATKDYFYFLNDIQYKKLLNIGDLNFKDAFINERDWKQKIATADTLIPFDGVSLLNVHHNEGVSLILHGENHLPFGVPTCRIFEAAAANSVIISDPNPFVREHFGDNVLYIDVSQDADTIAKQIDQHMQWIFSHPQEAQQLAQKCHEIFLEKFTLEAQIQRLMALHHSLRQ